MGQYVSPPLLPCWSREWKDATQPTEDERLKVVPVATVLYLHPNHELSLKVGVLPLSIL